MGLLEQLDNDAEQKRRTAAVAVSEERRRAQRWCEQLLPGMRSLDVYLNRLVADLIRTRPTIRQVLPLPGYGDVVACREHRYTLRSQPGGSSYEISLAYSAEVESEQCPLVTVEGVRQAAELTDVLWKQRLFGRQLDEPSDAGEAAPARFRARGRIASRIRISADRASGCARVHFTNVEGFGQSVRNIAPEELTPSMFDALGRLIAESTTLVEPAAGVPPQDTAAALDRRQRARRAGGVRVLADGELATPGRRADDLLTAARLAPWVRAGALPGRVTTVSRPLTR